MQYPPQQPTNQPYYPPAEMVMQEQSQAYTPQIPIYAPQSQQFVPGQEIAIYYNRVYAILLRTLLAICFLLLLGLPISGFIFNGPLQPGDIAPMIFTLVICICGMIFTGWYIWRLSKVMRKPILIINSQGITVEKVMLLSSYFISWTEVEAVFSSRLLFKYFCILPKNPDEFLTRFKGLDRFSRRRNPILGAPLYIPQGYLNKPNEEIIRAIYFGYANELNNYRVQLRP